MNHFKSHAGLTYVTRINKAKKIVSILKEHKDLSKCKILDLGTGAGVISSELGKLAKEVYSIDVIDERITKKNYKFKKINPNKKLPFKDKFFDIVISNHVIEHVNDKKFHLAEIFRVLEEDGICYLATPNKLWIIEPHYKLPFLSLLPKKIANLYLIITNKGKFYDVNNLSYNSLIKLFRKSFYYENILVKISKNPKRYNLEINFLNLTNLLNPIIKVFPFLLNYFTPTFIFILKKK